MYILPQSATIQKQNSITSKCQKDQSTIGWVEINGERINIGPGDFFVVPEGYTHKYGADELDPWTIYWIHFKGDSADACIDSHLSKYGSFKAAVLHHSKRIQIFEKMYQHVERGYGLDSVRFTNMTLVSLLSSFLFPEELDSDSNETVLDPVNTSIEYCCQKSNRFIYNG